MNSDFGTKSRINIRKGERAVSTIAKVCVVLIFGLSVAFCAVSAQLFAKKDKLTAEFDKYKKEAEEKIATSKARIEKLESELTQLKSKNAELANRITVVEREREEARARAKEQELAKNTAQKEKAQLMVLYDALNKKVEEWVKNTAAVEAEYNKMKQELTAAQQAFRDKDIQIKKLQDELNTKTKQVAELDAQITELKKRLEARAAGATAGAEYQPPIDAKVIKVDPRLNLVVIDKGRKDDVGVGYIFTVYRGDKYVGDLRIESVQNEFSGGSPVPGTLVMPIQEGDSASTRIR